MDSNIKIAIIGIFISSSKLKKLKLGNHDSIYCKLLNWAKRLCGEAFLFSVDDIDWKRLLVRGYVYSDTDQLEECLYPLPEVIYNRCFGTKGIEELNLLLTETRSVKGINVMPNPIEEGYEYDTIPPDFKPAKLLDCPIEVRTLVQKDFTGDWQYTGGTIRLIQGTEITSDNNLFGHYPLDNGLKEIFPENQETIKASLIKKVLNEAYKLEKTSPNTLELGIDLVLDHMGNSWIKKINENPIKNFITNFRGSFSAHLCITRPIEYLFKKARYPITPETSSSYMEQKPAKVNPLIGIFEELDSLEAIKAQQTDLHQLAIAKASNDLGCTVYHFSLPEIEDTNGIQGWSFDHIKQKWIQKFFPWPDVLYNRATFRLDSQRQIAKQFRKDLKRSGTVIFLNTRSVFGKGFTSTILEQMPSLKGYLPFNIIQPSPNEVKSLLNSHKSVFIKTEYGSDIRGVIKLTRQEKTYIMHTRSEKRSFQNFSTLWSEITEIIKSNPFVVQEGIDTLLYKARPLNIRSIVQKNGSGTWEVSLVKPWIATDSLGRGYPLPLEEVIANDKVQDELHHVSLAVAKTLEAHTGPLGELGIDIVPDPSGHPWVIEVNGKTNKSFFVKDEKPEAYYHLFYNPIAYGSFLAKKYGCKHF